MKLYYGKPGSGKTCKLKQEISEIFKSNNDNNLIAVSFDDDQYKDMFMKNNGIIIEGEKFDLNILKNKENKYILFNISGFKKYFDVLKKIFTYLTTKDDDEKFYLFIEEINILDNFKDKEVDFLFHMTEDSVSITATSQEIPRFFKKIKNIRNVNLQIIEINYGK